MAPPYAAVLATGWQRSPAVARDAWLLTGPMGLRGLPPWSLAVGDIVVEGEAIVVEEATQRAALAAGIAEGLVDGCIAQDGGGPPFDSPSAVSFFLEGAQELGDLACLDHRVPADVMAVRHGVA